ncbi:MAG: HNH endonuclease [Selenomonadaceae bacterium]|nr:HNH endonuclease [Selenomonadaceae bacterium]
MATNLEFRKIPSLKFLYEVNDDGTIFRNARSKRVKKCYKQSHNSNTEHWVTTVKIDGKTRKVFIHKVVAECWLGAKPEGYEIDHIDRNSLNNHWTNLRYVTGSEQMLNRDYSQFMGALLTNLAIGNGGHINPVRLIRGNETHDFPTARRAAKFLAQIYPHKNEKSFNDKFYHRRHRIFDYDVIYLNAETGHGSQDMGKEQSNLYLVGTTDRWNDAKKSEEHDRVKHNIFN